MFGPAPLPAIVVELAVVADAVCAVAVAVGSIADVADVADMGVETVDMDVETVDMGAEALRSGCWASAVAVVDDGATLLVSTDAFPLGADAVVADPGTLLLRGCPGAVCRLVVVAPTLGHPHFLHNIHLYVRSNHSRYRHHFG